MAILGDIRKQTGLLIVVIGVAMLAFVAGDLFSENSVVKRMFTGDPNEVGSINGESISAAEFINAQSAMRSGQNMSQNQINQQVWNSLIAQKLIQSHAEKAGLEVNDEEVWNFLAKQYGMGSAEELKNEIGQLKGMGEQGNQQAKAMYQEFIMNFEMTKPNLLRQKYMDMVTMGIATTNHEAKMTQAGNIQNATIDYGFVSYEDLKKHFKIEVTDTEILNYAKKYSNYYEADATVDLSYVYFPARPSKKDETKVKNELAKLLTQSIVEDKVNNITDTIPSFASVKDDSAFVAKYSERPFNNQFIGKKEIEQFKASMPEDYYEFLMNGSVGDVGGPFKTGDAYQLAKISAMKEIADSINSSHILISYAGTGIAQNNPSITRTREEARVLADSIQNMANAGNFKQLVAEYSEDQGSKTKDGNIGWVSHNTQSLVAEYVNFLNEHSAGEIGVAESQFGFHIIRIDGVKTQPGYLVANIVKDIAPSQDTSDKNFSDARTFAQDIQGKSLNDFANMAQKAGYNYFTADNVNRYYGQALVDPSTGFSNDKDNDILKWAFSKDAKVGSTNLFTTANDDHIIVYVNGKNPKGLASAKMVRDEVEPILMQQKLAQKINEDFGANLNVDSFIAKFKGEKGETTLTFGSAQIAGKGAEPKVAGAAFGMKPGSNSKAIQGREGIYVINLKSIGDKPNVEDATFLIDQLTKQSQQTVEQQLIPSMVMSADIKDNRMKILDRQAM